MNSNTQFLPVYLGGEKCDLVQQLRHHQPPAHTDYCDMVFANKLLYLVVGELTLLNLSVLVVLTLKK